MSHWCYIIYSKKINKFYIGETDDFESRLSMHNLGFSTFTSKANDWVLHVLIECSDRPLALQIEKHIKTMKSRTYIENLVRYPEMVDKLKHRFQPGP